MHQPVAARLASRARLVSRLVMAAPAALALLAVVLAPLPLQAQAPAAIGTLEGRDASVEHPAAAAADPSAGTPVGNGSVIVVHSGKAHLQLTGGGAMSICGPAKFTVLESGNALTVALEFGRLHISLPDTAMPPELYTPFFTALPQSTEDGSREFVAGLDSSGIFCARAIHGGVKLEQQLTGHLLVVPEPSESFLQGGDITPLRNPPGHCECDATLADLSAAPAPAPATETADAVPASARPPTTSSASSAPVARGESPGSPVAASPSSALIPRLSSHAPASASPSPSSPPAAPASSGMAPGGAAVTMPALAFDYSAHNPVTIVNPDADALLNESRVTPDWVFHGTVGNASKPAVASISRAGASAGATAQASPAQHRQSFWSKLKHFFGGG
jgi:hypothetical protein